MEQEDKSTAVKSFEQICVVLFLFMISVGLLRVFARHSTNIEVPWATGLATALLVIVMFLSAAIAQIRDRHIKITVFRDWIDDHISYPLRSIFILSINIVSLLISIIIVYASFKLTITNQDYIYIQTISWMKQGHIYLIVFVSFLIASLHIFITTLREIDIGAEKISQVIGYE